MLQSPPVRPVISKFIPVVLAILALLGAGSARAQEEDFTGDRPARPSAPARVVQTGRGSGEVTITVRSFGVANVSRPGEWIGVWVDVSDSLDKVRNVMLRMGDRDLDGDTAHMQRVIVTNPGSTQLGSCRKSCNCYREFSDSRSPRLHQHRPD